MNRRNYPLNALRAFESAARHLSFVAAAEELSVTPTAISHQIKKLEEYLAYPCFDGGREALFWLRPVSCWRRSFIPYF